MYLVYNSFKSELIDIK